MKSKIIVGGIIFAVGIGGLVLYIRNIEPPTGHSEIEPEIEFIYTDDLIDYVSPEDQALRDRLTPLQYEITQNEGTEVPFDNEYWDNHEEGIYVDVVSGEPLFSSTEKFDSGTGWPSFLRPLNFDFVVEKTDYKLIYPRTEIRSTIADSHLGHIILDGPESNDYIRYCMNSASMRFVPVSDLEEEGLGQYSEMFQ